MAPCPAGTRVVGGGAETLNAVGIQDFGEFVSSIPTADGTGYTATVEATGFGSGTLRVRAVCM